MTTTSYSIPGVDSTGVESFRTKRGRCILTDEELRVETGVLAQVRRYWEGNRLLLAAYLVVYAVLLFGAAEVVRAENWRAVGFGAVAVGILLVAGRALNRQRGVTGDDRIPLRAIEGVEAVAGDDWLTRPRFVVSYWRGNAIAHRYVMMPSGLLSYGHREFEQATELFREAGIPVEKVEPGDAVA